MEEISSSAVDDEDESLVDENDGGWRRGLFCCVMEVTLNAWLGGVAARRRRRERRRLVGIMVQV